MLTIRKILVPTDFSPCAAAALDLAAEFAQRFDAEILLVHVVPVLAPYLPAPLPAPLPAEWIESTRKLAQAELSKERKRVDRVQVATELRDGPVVDSVLDAAAASGADLIVIGTHGRRGLSHVLLGSVAERVVRQSPIPVLTVRGPRG